MRAADPIEHRQTTGWQWRDAGLGSCLLALVVLTVLGSPEAAGAQPRDPLARTRPCAGGGDGWVPALCFPGEIAHCGLCATRVCADGRWSACTVDTSVPCVPPDPSWVDISDGPEATPADVAQFDARWIHGEPHAVEIARRQLCGRCDECVWQLAERMHALVRMRDLTQRDLERSGTYLRQLHTLVEHALAYRDDRHQGGVCEPNGPFVKPRALDEVRGRIVRAWGGQSPGGGDMHSVSPAVSNLYAYALAAFARMVFEDERLWDVYGSDAVKHANAVIETVWEFMPQVTTRRTRGGFVEAYLISRLPGHKVPTKDQCKTAYDNEVERIKRDEEEEDWNKGFQRAEQMRSDCENAPKIGPEAHNINLVFGMVLIELSRAIDSPFYRHSPAASSDAQRTREMLPLLVSRLHRFFANRLFPKSGPEGGRYCWNFSDDLHQTVKYHVEDTSHGAFDMRFIELLSRDFDRLNAVAQPRGEPIALDAADMRRFANTFLRHVFRGEHLAENVIGKPMPSGAYDDACHGWVILAAADPRVYTACRNLTLRFSGRTQPKLGIGSHAALLANKRFVPPAEPPPPLVIVPDVTELHKKNASDAIRAAGLVPKYRERTAGNWVARQEPKAGVQVPRGSTVELSLRPNAPN
jgi:hypothetical protein